MKKFKYPLAITGPVEELEALVPELEGLGYYMGSWSVPERYLLTGFLSTSGLGYDSSPNRKVRKLIFDSSQKDLILALAAMVDDSKFYEGEWVVYCGDELYGLKTNEFQRIDRIEEDGRLKTITLFPYNDWVNGSWFCKHPQFRKATKEEIIEHFTKKDMNVTQEPKKVTLSSEFVRQAHAAACEDWKKRIEEELPELFPKVELTEKAGKFFSGNSGSYEQYWLDNLSQLLYSKLTTGNGSEIDRDRRLAAIKIMNLIAEEWG